MILVRTSAPGRRRTRTRRNIVQACGCSAGELGAAVLSTASIGSGPGRIMMAAVKAARHGAGPF